MRVQIAPSILSADFRRLAEEVTAVEQAGADLLHLDVMDGHFVPNITFGPAVIRAIKSVATVPLDVHLMIENPADYIEEFASVGADIITVHVESCPHLHRVIHQIKDLGVRAGASLNPSTPIDNVRYMVDDLDMVLIMSVNPGFSGQKFIPQILKKIAHAKELIGNRVNLQVDGGITTENAAAVVKAGADILVAGSSVFSTSDYALAIRGLRGTQA
ncbi:MAG: ribulose-phosphate 3-epimerase [Candidatus Abyssobacteria bacterium SURF_5]|uniref:Ribulose-phosphate 3-epimerase n=1 Tax=Abyssobacteria bacterium (strain SURF_5) TaxID=2093360 RepID=A0A3A4MVN6_ABYX5|nr:MAG: ribulose-phosphate 3-epimerase [Candidatus Abyssubacteria bacterium SURF_5]